MAEEKVSAFAKASADKKWNKEVSAGGVVYKKENGVVFVLLIMPMGPGFSAPEGYWTFPKGKLDDGDTNETAAVREVREEAGVNAQIESNLGSVKYFRKAPYGNAIKFVHYFLMKYIDGDPKDHDEETHEAKWFQIDEVVLKFPTDKDIFKKAKKLLE